MRSHISSTLGVVALSLMLAPVAAAQRNTDAPRTPDGRPDLSGSYDTATLTPLQRPREFGDRLSLSDEEAAAIRGRRRHRVRAAVQCPGGARI